MLAAEMLLDEQWIHCCPWIECERDVCHLCHLLHDNCIIHGIVGILTPRERTVVLHQHTGCVNGIDVSILDTLYDNITGLQLIVALYLSLGHGVGARNLVVEIVGMCCSDVWDVLTCLCPSSGIG